MILAKKLIDELDEDINKKLDEAELLRKHGEISHANYKTGYADGLSIALAKLVMSKKKFNNKNEKKVKEINGIGLDYIYDEVLELRNRLSIDGNNEIFEEDHMLLDLVLDLIEKEMKENENTII